MITQIREACGAGRVRINGVCVARTTKRQAPQVCAMEWRRLRSLLLRHHPTGWGRKDRVCSNTLNLPQSGLSPTMTFDAYKPVERVVAK